MCIFRVLRQSYSTHQHRYLLKLTIIGAYGGPSLEIRHPYISDSRNNDGIVVKTFFSVLRLILWEIFFEENIINLRKILFY